MERNKKSKAAALCLIAVTVAFLGFWFENIFIAITDGYMDNRNMMLPFLLGHGLGMVAVYLIFGLPSEPRFLKINLKIKKTYLKVIYYFTAVFVAVSVGEALLGTFVEKVFDITWWDYSGIPLHITKFTSVPTSIGFAFVVIMFMHFVFERLMRLFLRMNRKVLYTLAIIFAVVLFADFVIAAVRMYTTSNFVYIWRIDFR